MLFSSESKRNVQVILNLFMPYFWIKYIYLTLHVLDR